MARKDQHRRQKSDYHLSLDEANEILGLMMRHWNTIAGTLLKGEVYVPLLG